MTSGIFASSLALVLTGLWVLTLPQPMVDAAVSIPDNISVTFSLYKRDTPKDAPEIAYLNENGILKFETFEPSKKTVVALHCSTKSLLSLKSFARLSYERYVLKEDVNFILVDWIKLANDTDFLEFMANTDYAGRQVADMIRILRKSSNNVQDFLFVGLEYGCIVGAIAGYKLREYRPERFMALDPPHIVMFEFPTWSRLSRTSADVVEVVHTSGRFRGTLEPLGHRDFYVNGGAWPQPVCGSDKSGECSVLMSLEVFLNSMEYTIEGTYCEGYKKFMDKLCLDKTKIPLYNNATAREFPRGKYYINYTNINTINEEKLKERLKTTLKPSSPKF